MGAVERDIDRYSDEMGRLDERESRAEQRFIDEREDLAERLAAGHEIRVNKTIKLDFDDILDSFFHREKQVKATFKLCMMNSGVGGLHMKRMITEIAQELVDDFSEEIKAEMENDNEH